MRKSALWLSQNWRSQIPCCQLCSFEVRRGDAVRIFLRAQTGPQDEEVGQIGCLGVGCFSMGKLKQWIWNSRDASCEFGLQESDIRGLILHSTTFVLTFSLFKLDENDLGSLWISVLISDLLYPADLSARPASRFQRWCRAELHCGEATRANH